MDNEFKLFKNNFLEKYNPKRTIENAISLSIKAAVQHNSLYSEKLSSNERLIIRKDWGNKLQEISIKYKNNTIDSEIYYKDITDLKNYMNEMYKEKFRTIPHPKYNYDAGFRISHSQKSISVFLKHLWCLELISSPPQCPVDRIVLEKIGLKGQSASWGYINTLDNHISKIKLIEKVAKSENKSIPIWELTNFTM